MRADLDEQHDPISSFHAEDRTLDRAVGVLVGPDSIRQDGNEHLISEQIRVEGTVLPMSACTENELSYPNGSRHLHA